MIVRYIGAPGAIRSRCAQLLSLALLACLAVGCSNEPRPRSYMEFMEDSLAREGTLARCNRDREATAGDAECMNARRAASSFAARADEALRDQREADSDMLRAAASDRAASAHDAKQRAQADAEAQVEAEYEAQWSETQEVMLADGSVAEPAHDQGIYGSIGSTLDGAMPAPELTPEYEQPSLPTLDFIQLSPSVAPAMPYVKLPESARRLELAPEPQLEEISIPDTATYRQ